MTHNALPHIERALASVSRYPVIVVDNGSTDTTPAFVRRRFPHVEVVEQPNRGFAAGVNAGVRATSEPYLLLLNPDAWVVGDAVKRLFEYAELHPRVAVAGPRLRFPDGRPQISMRGFPTLWRLATQYLLMNRLLPRSRTLNSFYGGGSHPDQIHEVDFLKGACILVRRSALMDVGPFDEDYFMFVEEADWCYRASRRGWRTVYLPEAEAVHVGEATTKSVWSYERAFLEQERSHLRFFLKHRGRRTAEAARSIIAAGYVLRWLLGRGERRRAYRTLATTLLRARTSDLLQTGTA